MRTIRLTALVVPVVGLAVAAATAAAPSGSAGSSTPPTQSVVAALPLKPIPPLEGTEWRLVGIGAQGRTLTAPYGSAVTLRVDGGRFVLRTCNLMQGQAIRDNGRLELRNEWGTHRACTGTLGRLDSALHEAFLAPLRVRQEATSLRLTSLDSTAHFRAAESMQPPLQAQEVAVLDDVRGNCRVLAAPTDQGPRLWVLARTRPGGPWRLLPGGPVAPEAGPVAAPALASTAGESSSVCTAGFAPAGTTSVAPGRTIVRRVVGIEQAVYVASVSRTADQYLEARAGDGSPLGTWPVRRR